jgi:hypothetical protein
MTQRSWAVIVCGALLVLFAVRLVDSVQQNSLTVDEPHYVGLGLYLWESGDYHYAESLSFHPPLAYHLASLPLLAIDLTGVPIDRRIGRRLLSGEVIDPANVRLISRLPFVGLAIWGAFLCFAWARELSGDAAGVLALFLATFSPMWLAHGSLAHSDIVVSVLLLQTLYTGWRHFKAPSALRLGIWGVSFGLALLAKLSAFLFFPMLALLLAGRAAGWLTVNTASDGGESSVDSRSAAQRWGHATGEGALVCAVALVVVWIGWGGSFAAHPIESGPFTGWLMPGFVHAGFVDRAINEAGRDTYLFGELSSKGWWYYFPLAFAVKTPVALLLLLAAALFVPAGRPAALTGFLGVAAAVYLGVAMFYLDVPLGLRYVLPVYPWLFVFVAARSLPSGSTWRRAGIAGACIGLAAASLWVRPHYLSHFNAAVGGPTRGSEYLLDANIDWGQSLPALADWLAQHENPPVRLAYFGPENPALYGIRARPLRGCQPVRDLVALSANVRGYLYHGSNPFARPKRDCYRWLDEHEPVARPGGSIVVYDLR